VRPNDRNILGAIRLFVLFMIIIVVFVGCSVVPSNKIARIYKTRGLLHVFTSDGYIRTFDSKTHNMKAKKKFPNMRYGMQYNSPSLKKILQDEDRLIIQASQRFGCSRVYLSDMNMKMKEILDLQGESTNKPVLVGVDSDYYYFRKAKFEYSEGIKQSGFYYGFRIGKGSMEQVENHFDTFPQLTTAAVFDDEESYWYVCFYESEMVEGSSRLVPGRLVMVSASKDNKEYRVFDSGRRITAPWMDFVNTSRSLWLFLGEQIIKFSKENGQYEVFRTQTRMVPFPYHKEDKGTRYVWAMSADFGERNISRIRRGASGVFIAPPRDNNLYRIDRDTLEIVPTPVTIPEEIKIPTFYKEICSDDEYVWISAYKVKREVAPSGNQIPYLLRISKASLSAEPLLIKPTVGEAIATVSNNVLAILTFPFWAHPM
jgi:hypothetical protein